ncbi:MAG TPA: flagellar hook-length control protein FliK [Roseiarcus sp.]
MTALAAAPASGPIAPAAPRAPPQPQADRFAFAVVLDSLPGAQTRAGASTAEGQPHSSKEPGQEESARGQPARHSPLNDSSLLASLPFALRASSNELGQGESTLGQPARHSLLNDSALLASLPFALRASSMGGQGPRAADDSPSPKTPTMKGPKSEDNGSSPAAGAKAATVGRLVGERAFHFGASPSPGVITSRALPVDRPFAPASVSDANPTSRPDLSGKSALAAGFPGLEAMPAKPFSDDVPSGDSAPAPAPIAPRAGTPPTNRVSPTRSAGHDATRSGRKAEVSAPPPAARVASSPAPAAPPESSGNGKSAGDHSPDPIASTAPSATQTGPFGAQLPAPFVAGAAFGPDATTAGAADADIARASPLGPSSAPSAPPVKEIDVDLSPGGLEDISMTMRLAGDKLSVVIRAASSQTLGSIEGARDAITDRMAAIGQPLDSLIVKQTGVNGDGNANGNAATADDGSAGGEWRSAQGADERGGGSDASLSRGGAGRDRGF